MDNLKEALQDIFFEKQPEFWKNIIPLVGTILTPTAGAGERTASWIGYIITDIHTNSMATPSGSAARGNVIKQVQGNIALTFVGPESFDLALFTLWFDDDSRVVKIFERYGVQVRYVKRHVYPIALQQDGANDTVAWRTNVGFASYLETYYSLPSGLKRS